MKLLIPFAFFVAFAAGWLYLRLRDAARAGLEAARSNYAAVDDDAKEVQRALAEVKRRAQKAVAFVGDGREQVDAVVREFSIWCQGRLSDLPGAISPTLLPDAMKLPAAMYFGAALLELIDSKPDLFSDSASFEGFTRRTMLAALRESLGGDVVRTVVDQLLGESVAESLVYFHGEGELDMLQSLRGEESLFAAQRLRAALSSDA